MNRIVFTEYNGDQMSRSMEGRRGQISKHNKDDQSEPGTAEKSTTAPSKSNQGHAARIPEEEVVNNKMARKGKEERIPTDPSPWRSQRLNDTVVSVATIVGYNRCHAPRHRIKEAEVGFVSKHNVVSFPCPNRTFGGASACGFQSRVNEVKDALWAFHSAENGVRMRHKRLNLFVIHHAHAHNPPVITCNQLGALCPLGPTFPPAFSDNQPHHSCLVSSNTLTDFSEDPPLRILFFLSQI
ncbi:hypothetical protein TNCV_1749001 [Trichonephila clavipes]|nr:hypothetical protein TNCV_1749001 [Trichonephila clavipes]